jgi:hypothetical protein
MNDSSSGSGPPTTPLCSECGRLRPAPGKAMCDVCFHLELQKRLGESVSIGTQGPFGQLQAPPGSVAVSGLPATPLGNTPRPKPYKGKGRQGRPPQTPTPSPFQPRLESLRMPDGSIVQGIPIKNISSSGPVAPMPTLPLRPQQSQPAISPFIQGKKRNNSDVGDAPASTGPVKKSKLEGKPLLFRGTWTWSDWIHAYNETPPIEGCERAYFEDSINNRIIALWEESERLTVTPKREILEPMTKPVSSDIFKLFEKAEFLGRRKSHLRIILTPSKGDTSQPDFVVPEWSEPDAKLHIAENYSHANYIQVHEDEPSRSDDFDFNTPRDILAHLRLLQGTLFLLKNKEGPKKGINKARTQWIEDNAAPVLNNSAISKEGVEPALKEIRRFRQALDRTMIEFVQGVTFVAQALLAAVQKTCKEGGAYDPKTGKLADKKSDPDALRILEADTVKAVTALELLRISFMKKVAWHKAAADLALANFGIDEDTQNCVDNLIGVSPSFEGLHGFPRLLPGKVDPPPARENESTDQSPTAAQAAGGASG